MEFPGQIVAALKMASQTDWNGLFDALVIEKLKQIEGCPIVELAALQAQVRAIRILQQDFLTNRQR
jgi:hypothetical protein